MRTRGDYVSVNGKLWPVTGSRQSETAQAALRDAKIPMAPIAHWDGTEWADTGLVLHGAPSRSGTTQTAAERRANGRPVVSLSMTTQALAELDRRRGAMTRSAYVQWMLIGGPPTAP